MSGGDHPDAALADHLIRDHAGLAPGQLCPECLPEPQQPAHGARTTVRGPCCNGRHGCDAEQVIIGKRQDSRGVRFSRRRCSGCGHEYETTVTVQDYEELP